MDINDWSFLKRRTRRDSFSPVRLLLIFRVLACLLGIAGTQLASATYSAPAALKNNHIQELEISLADVQKRFENGEISEYELRNAFRPFYDLDEVSARNLSQWASTSPRSYVAHLALGVYFKRKGYQARGDRYIGNTSASALEQMSDHYQMAMREFRTSLNLTPKPYLSLFHMLTITMQFGERETSQQLLRRANEILPSNSLVRNRYAVSLTPRWGGTHRLLDKFIEQTKAEGVPPTVVWQLEAIKSDDLGHLFEERNQHATAMEHFTKALELAARIGGTFSREFIESARYYGCTGPQPPVACK